MGVVTWKTCQAEVKDDVASCKIPLFKELKAGHKKKSYCVLTDGQNGKKLTQPYWSAIINVHDKVEEKKEKKEDKEEKKEKKEDKEEKKEKKEEKNEKKEKKEKKEKAEEKVEKTQKLEAKQDDSMKLPWMVAKEQRAAARKGKADEGKKEKKESKKPKNYGENDSGLPWME